MKINRHHLKSPIEIITTQLGIPLVYKQQCIDEIYSLGDSMNQKTNVKAIMSSYQIWNETSVYNSLLDKILEVINNIEPIKDFRFEYKLIEAWASIYKKNHYTLSHNHTPNDISFVYYLKATTNSSSLIFDSCNFQIQPQQDMLVIFPSYLKHSVPKQTDNEDRICLAGNLIFSPKDDK
jgi:hypothetical protein